MAWSENEINTFEMYIEQERFELSNYKTFSDRASSEHWNIASNYIFGKDYTKLKQPEVCVLEFYIRDYLNPIWKPVLYKGEETGYMINNVGSIRGKRKEILRKDIVVGYYRIDGYYNKQHIKISIHRAVAEAFIPNPENKPQVNHINGNKLCNWVGNLEWVTPKENTQHAVKTGLMKFKGTNHPENVYTEDQVHLACKMLEDRKSISDIFNATGINKSIIYSIRTKKSWTHISNNYDIPLPVTPKNYQSSKPHMKKRVMKPKTQFILSRLNDGSDKKDIANDLMKYFNATSIPLAIRSINKVNLKYNNNYEE